MILPTKRTTEALMREVGIDPAIIREALTVYESGVADDLIMGLAGPAAESCAIELGKQLTGNQMLGAYFCALQDTKRNYRIRGIPHEIFYATMECFPRFIEETRRRTGIAFFDRQGWVWRQTSMKLFRVGELEYELNSPEEIALHIPSGCDLSKGAVESSLISARSFIEKHFPECKNAKIKCTSWLLSPLLANMLPENSKILGFQSFFDIKGSATPSNDIKTWVFETDEDTPNEQLKSITSLQKQLKAFLLAGNKFYDGFGVLKDKH